MMRLDDLFSCSIKYSRKNVREFRGTWMKTCLKAIRRNNYGKTLRDILVHTSDRSQPCCRAGTQPCSHARCRTCHHISTDTKLQGLDYSGYHKNRIYQEKSCFCFFAGASESCIKSLIKYISLSMFPCTTIINCPCL